MACEHCLHWRFDPEVERPGIPDGSLGWCGKYGYTTQHTFSCPDDTSRLTKEGGKP